MNALESSGNSVKNSTCSLRRTSHCPPSCHASVTALPWDINEKIVQMHLTFTVFEGEKTVCYDRDLAVIRSWIRCGETILMIIWRATVIWRYGKKFIVIMGDMCISGEPNAWLDNIGYLIFLDSYTNVFWWVCNYATYTRPRGRMCVFGELESTKWLLHNNKKVKERKQSNYSSPIFRKTEWIKSVKKINK